MYGAIHTPSIERDQSLTPLFLSSCIGKAVSEAYTRASGYTLFVILSYVCILSSGRRPY